MAIDKTPIDQLRADYKEPENIIGENGLLKQLTKTILARALQAELTDDLGFEKHDPAGHHSGNSRNGSGRKALKGDFGELELETPRDRQASFELKIVAKGQTRFTGFDDKMISMYARGILWFRDYFPMAAHAHGRPSNSSETTAIVTWLRHLH